MPEAQESNCKAAPSESGTTGWVGGRVESIESKFSRQPQGSRIIRSDSLSRQDALPELGSCCFVKEVWIPQAAEGTFRAIFAT